MEGRRSAAEKGGSNDVVLTIADETSKIDQNNSQKGLSSSYSSSSSSSFSSSLNVEITEHRNLSMGVSNSSFAPSPCTERASNNKPPKIPTEKVLTQKRSFSSWSSLTKPKSRLVEPPNPRNAESDEESAPLLVISSSSPSIKVAAIAPRCPLIESPSDDEEDDDEVYKTNNLKESKKTGKKPGLIILAEWIAFLGIMAVLVCSLTVNKLEKKVIWGLGLWKWCVLVMVIFCGRLFSTWSLNFVVFLIESNFLLKKKVLYFVFGMKRSVQIFIWLGLVLLAWGLLINRGIERSKKTTRILNHVTRALAATLIGSVMWLLKTLLINMIASKYQCTRFFDRIQESIFHQYVVMVLSGSPPIERAAALKESRYRSGRMSFRNMKKRKEEEIDIDNLIKMKQARCSAWTMKGLVDVIRGSGLSTMCNTLENCDSEEGEQQIMEISSEWEAKCAASQIFRNVAKHEAKYIEEDDLLRYLTRVEVVSLLHLLGAEESLKIKRSTLMGWLVSVYKERKALAHSLNDAKTAIEELNRLLSATILILATIVWLLLMGFLTTKLLVFISSQLLLVAFVFGNAAKTVFEAIIFVFVMHPFDVGDRCVIDGVQMVVEEMNILTTVFLRYDNEKIFYPNSVLSTKPISNFYRSPDMTDAVEFDVHISTSAEKIAALKAKIKEFLESKPDQWRSDHDVLVKEIEKVNKMKMALYVTHTMNFQNYGEKSSRRSELVLVVKKFFEELGIEYHSLPQQVHVMHVETTAATATTGK